MGFDQYHEPPEELPEETRTFARLCASLTEEAEAIGWYAQRLAVEKDPEAHAVMSDAVGEEYKHFSMDLEFLLRRTPKWRAIAQGVLFQDGDIVEHGEAAEAAAGEDGGDGDSDAAAPARAYDGSLGIGSLKGQRAMSGHLLRSHAPITEAGWQRIDEEARARLTPGLAGRRLVDFDGPKGWAHSATSLGRVADADVSPLEQVEGRVRRVLPLVELRARFTVSRAELAAGDRGAEDVDFDALDAAAQRVVVAENTAVFHGWSDAGIDGIARVSPHDPIPCGDEIDRWPSHVARAVETLLRNGVSGPYGLALGREEYTRVTETAEHGGYPLFDHLRKILGGPIVWAPGVDGGVVLSLRGGDFLFDSGQDIAVGYEGHDAESVTLYLEESFSFRVVSPEAAVAIVR